MVRNRTLLDVSKKILVGAFFYFFFFEPQLTAARPARTPGSTGRSTGRARPKGEITIVSAMPGQRKRKKPNLDSLVVSRISLTNRSPMHMHIHPSSRCQTRSRCVDKNILRSDPSTVTVRFWYRNILDFWVGPFINRGFYIYMCG